jgi:hypothetical protein
MTDCALAAPAPQPTRLLTTTRRARRTRPAGVPRWAWLLGVTVVPLAPADPDAPQTWVLSAGAGTTHASTLLHDAPDAPDAGADPASRGDRS